MFGRREKACRKFFDLDFGPLELEVDAELIVSAHGQHRVFGRMRDVESQIAGRVRKRGLTQFRVYELNSSGIPFTVTAEQNPQGLPGSGKAVLVALESKAFPALNLVS